MLLTNETYLAKRYATTRGHGGQLGGWIYDQNGRPLCQGWLEYYRLYQGNIMPWARRASGLNSGDAADVAAALKGKRIPCL